MREHHQRMKPEVGHLIDQGLSVAAFSDVLRRQDDLGRLFADFLQDLVQSLYIQGGDIRAVG